MEQIVAKLLVPDNKVIQQGTSELKEAFKNPDSILALFDILVSCNQADFRQTSAVLLRRRFSKRSVWMKLDEDLRNRLRRGVMEALIHEKVKHVKNAIAHLIAILGKHEINSTCWSEIFQFIIKCCNSENELEKELGMYILSILTEESPESYFPYFDQFILLFNKVLGSLTVLKCNAAHYVVITLLNFIPKSSGNQLMVNLYHNTLPRVLEIIKAFASAGDDETNKTVSMLEFIEELIEYIPAALVPHISLITNVCLSIAVDQNTDSDVKTKTIGVLSFVIEAKSKIMMKENLIEPVVDTMMIIMSQTPEDNDEIEIEAEEFVPVKAASKALDILSLNLPPEKIIPLFLSRIETFIQHNDPYHQKAAYITLAVIVEGCSEFIRKKYMESFLKCVYDGINHKNVVVRNAAFFALGQFAEHLQPEISNYSADVLPLLLKNFSDVYMQVQSGQSKKTSIDRLFYALETFCENLNDNLVPYLPSFMDHIFIMLDPNSTNISIKKMCFNTISSIATAVKEAMLPYFARILSIINVYVNSDSKSDNFHVICDALDCLSTLALTIGDENFKPVAESTMELALRILDAENSDVEAHRATFAVIGALAVVMKNDFAPVVPTVVKKMMDSFIADYNIDVGIMDQLKELDVYDLNEPEEEVQDEEEDIGAESITSEDSGEEEYHLLNKVFNEEKEQICKTLKDISSHVGDAFMPYLENCFSEVFKNLNIAESGLQKASLEALTQFCVTLYNSNSPQSKQSLYTALQMLIPKCSELIRLETDREVVMAALDTYETLLREIKDDVFVGDGHREAIMNCIIDVYNLKTSCQEPDVDIEDESDSEQAELVVEYAGDIIPYFGKAMKPSEFVQYFPNIVTIVGKRTNTKRSESQRSFSYGILAECMQALDGQLDKFVDILLKVWSSGIEDQNNEARNNSVFGIGELVYYGKNAVFPYYSEILQWLSALTARESDIGTIDNICSAVAKLITVNSFLVPLEQVFPSFMERLPLRKDFQENLSIVRCFYTLYQQGNPLLKQHLTKAIQVIAHIYCYQCNENTDAVGLLKELLKIINNDFGEEFSKSLQSLEPVAFEKLHSLLSS